MTWMLPAKARRWQKVRGAVGEMRLKKVHTTASFIIVGSLVLVGSFLGAAVRKSKVKIEAYFDGDVRME